MDKGEHIYNTYKRRSGRIGSGRYMLCIPEFDLAEDKNGSLLNNFYGDIADNCFSFCQREMENMCRDGCTWIYTLECKVTYNDGNIICVLLCAAFDEDIRVEGVYMGSHRRRISEFYRSQVWDISEGKLLPPRSVIRLFSGNKKGPPHLIHISNKKSVLITNDALFVLEENGRKNELK